MLTGVVPIWADGSADFPSPGVAGATSNATSSDAIEAAAKEEKNPGDESEPNAIANRRRTALHRIQAGLRYEKEGDVEDESYKGYGGGKTRYATAETTHGELTNMGKEAKEGSDCSETESDDVEYEDISEPFDDDLRYLNGSLVTDKGVYILVGR